MRPNYTSITGIKDLSKSDINYILDLAEKLDYWLEHPQARQQCSQQYLGYARQFDDEECMDKMEQLLRDAVEGACHAH